MSFSAAALIGAAGIGAAGSMGSSGLNGLFSYKTAKSLAKYNYELGQRALYNSPSSYKQGLIKAGINPILASDSPVGSTQGSTGVNPNFDIGEGAAKGIAVRNAVKQTDSNVELQEKQGNAALEQAGAAGAQATAANKSAEAALINAQTNAKKAGVEIEGVRSSISLNEAKMATEKALQGKHISEETKNNVASLAQWVTSEMSRAELDYWKRHPEQFDKYMEEKLKSEGNMNSARDWKKWTDAANTLLNVVDKVQDFVPGKKSSLGIKRGAIKYAPGF